MKTKFICLANSFKEGGRCMAGIELDANNNPVLNEGRPKWIRPVCDTPHGEIPNHIAQPFHVLDILEIDVTGNRPENYQSENVAFNENSITKTGTFDRNQLKKLCDNRTMIFDTKGKSISQEAIGNLDHSLMLVNVTLFEATFKSFEDKQKKPQIRLVFSYNESVYDFPITDPVFLQRYKYNPDLFKNVRQAYLCLSLGIPWEGFHYKLVATILF